MSASNTRRRLALLTGSSLFTALLMAGGVTLAPSAALADNECGDPNANTTTNDTFQCTGTFASITYPATNGNLTLQLQNNVTTTTGGLVVTASGANTVTINRIADSPANSGDPSLTSTSTTNAALQVTSAAGGTISVTLTDNDTTDAPLVISGVNGGVRLRNAGVANTTFTSSNGAISASAGVGIDVGTLSVAGGTVNVTNGSTVTASTYGIRAATAGTGVITVTNNGAVTGATGAILIASGVNATITNNATGVVNGVVTMNNTGTATFTNNGTWNVTDASFLGSGATTLTNSATGVISLGGTRTLDFGAGTDTFANLGTLAVGSGAESAATLTLGALETWNNTGRVLFGANSGLTGSDGVTNDRVVMGGGGLFNGLKGTLMMDVNLAGDQASCASAVAADCLDLRGSSTNGQTIIAVSATGVLAPGHRIVLVDVAGSGTSAADNFGLDPNTPNYRRVGSVDTVENGLLFYGLTYDAAAQQHALVTGFNDQAFAVTRIGRAATEPWRAVTGMWQDRQADLRDTLSDQGGGFAPRVWLKVASNIIEADGIDTSTAQIEYNAGFTQRTGSVVGGVDLVRKAGADSAWVVGVTVGKLDSTLDYTTLDSDLDLDGVSLGLYSTFVTGALYVDAIVNHTDMDLTHRAAGVQYTTSASSLGYQLESGYRLLQFNDGGAYIEPLAAISYVRTELDDLAIGSVTADVDEATSLRGALGLRIGGDFVTDAVTAKLSFTGRAWQEFESENQTVFSGAFGDAVLGDAGPETLGDVGVALGLFTMGNRLSANLGYGVRFNDGYQSRDASVSIRFNW